MIGSKEDWKSVAEERAEIINRMANKAWEAVYGEQPEKVWVHPMQALLVLITAYNELAALHTKTIMLDVVNRFQEKK